MKTTSYRTVRPISGRASAAGLLLCLCVLSGGCTDEDSGRPGGAPPDAPALVPIDSVALRETDGSYLASLGDLEIGPDGGFLISDYQAKTVHAFARDGRSLGRFGRGGRGPGEFKLPGDLVVDGDSLLYAADNPGIEVFDARTFAHRGSYPTPTMVQMMAVSRGRLFAGHVDAVQRGSVARITGDGSPLRVTGPFPELLRSEVLFQVLPLVALAVRGDTVATAYSVTRDVYLATVAGRVLDSIPVPARRRHGVDPAALRRLAVNPTDQKSGLATVYGTSQPHGLHWLPGGTLALVSVDWRPVEDRFEEVHYLSVVDPRTRRSCVDARIPGPIDPPVSAGFRGDTLFVVSQEVGETTRMATTVRLYRIETDGCQWVSN